MADAARPVYLLLPSPRQHLQMLSRSCFARATRTTHALSTQVAVALGAMACLYETGC